MREWWSKLSHALRLRRGLDDDLSDEMRAHLDLITEENIERGMTPNDARAAARRHFGNLTRTQEKAREAWQFPRFETVLQDIRYGLRGLRKAPSFSAVVILTLALGIGANTAIFSVVYSVLLRPLPYPHGERLVRLGESTAKAAGIAVTWINFQHWRTESTAFDDMAATESGDFTLTGRGDAVLVHAQLVTSDMFRLTGMRPALGRLFTDSDDKPGTAPTAIVTAEFWRSSLGGDPHVIGESLELNGTAYQIIGVLRPGPKYLWRAAKIYLPLGRTQDPSQKRSHHASLRGIALLKTGVTATEARANLDAIMQMLALSDPGPEDDHRSYVEYLAEDETGGGIRTTLLVLMGAVGLVLIIACANVASLLLVRSTGRAREIAVRVAIGAGRSRLARQLLTENLVIAAIGGLLGLLLAAWCLRTFILIGPRDIPRLSDATLDVPVLLFAAAISIAVGLLAGLAPVLTAGKVDLTVALKEGSPTAGTGKRGQVFRSGLVIAEIAVTLILAFASGLLIRSLIAAQNADPGFDPQHLLAIELQLPPSRYASGDSVRQYYGQLAQNLRAEPGVEDVGLVMCPPGAGDCGDYWYSIVEKPTPARDDVPLSLFNVVDENYLRTARMRIIAGRAFSDADRPGGTLVTIINEELAREAFANPQAAVGKHLKVGGPYAEGPTLEIVGVVGGISQMGLDSERWPTFFYPFSQKPDSAMVVTMRTNGGPAQWMRMARRQVSALDRNVPIQSLRTAEDWLGASLQQRRFATLLLGIFGALAMVLAAVGIYGVLNYWVAARQKEIAIRLAVGAPRAAILRWAGLHATRLAAIGIVFGGIGAWNAARWMESLLFGVKAHSPQMMLEAAVAVMVIAAAAASVPVWRAMRTDAVRNLHEA
ncbi:MAG TPA: ABC transporter permease [Candidatus Methylomirabilis sp.]|nr:ABC transporter permease [Candidatus Methylomirabilis sp.]